MNVTAAITKEYENKSNWAICENKPKQTQFLSAISVAGQRQNNQAKKWAGNQEKRDGRSKKVKLRI